MILLKMKETAEAYLGGKINDAVVTAGTPYRMIELALSIDGHVGPELSGDGLIIATPIGSTAYNVSAGGPIVHPDVHAMILTPHSAHGLACRPIVTESSAVITVEMIRANPGSSLVLDGRVATQLAEGDVVEVRAHTKRALLVSNPSSDYWQTLISKLRWALPPNYQQPGD